jgi:hypothetical protein
VSDFAAPARQVCDGVKRGNGHCQKASLASVFATDFSKRESFQSMVSVVSLTA